MWKNQYVCIYLYVYIYKYIYTHTHIYVQYVLYIHIYLHYKEAIYFTSHCLYNEEQIRHEPDSTRLFNLEQFYEDILDFPTGLSLLRHFSSFGRKTSVTDTLSQSVTGTWVPLAQLAYLHRFTHVSPFLFPFTWFYLTCSIVPGLKPHHRILHRLCAATMGAVRTFPHSNASIARHQCSITFILLDVYFVWILGWSADQPGAP